MANCQMVKYCTCRTFLRFIFVKVPSSPEGVESLNIVAARSISNTVVPVISFVCFQALEKIIMPPLGGEDEKDNFLVLPTGKENEDG